MFKFFEKDCKKRKLHWEKEKTKIEPLGEKMVIFKFFFFAKSTSDKYCFLCHLQKQNYPIHHSNQAFNAHQIEISVKPVSIAKGCRLLIYLVFIH